MEQKDINRDGVGRPEKDKAEGRQTDGLMGEDTEEVVGEVHWGRQPPAPLEGSTVCFHRSHNMSPGGGDMGPTWLSPEWPRAQLDGARGRASDFLQLRPAIKAVVGPGDRGGGKQGLEKAGVMGKHSGRKAGRLGCWAKEAGGCCRPGFSCLPCGARRNPPSFLPGLVGTRQLRPGHP